MDLFTFRESNQSYFPKDHWELTIMIILGGMGSGKTETMKYLSSIGKEIYQDEFHCFQTNDLIYALKFLNQNIEERTKVEFIFFDDALDEGMDSRRSMSAENIMMSQNLAVIRHLLANEDKNKIPDPRSKGGYAVIVYGIQSPTRLDRFIRENAHLTIYKTYYDNLESEKIPDESLQYIKDITEDSMYKHKYIARGAGLGITKTKKAIHLYFPKIQFDIPVLVPPPERYDELLTALIEVMKDEENPNTNYLKGFILDWCEKHDITLAQSDITRLIAKASFLKTHSQISTIDPEKYQQLLTALVDYMKDKEELNRSILQGFILDWCEKNPPFTLSSNEIVKVIHKASYLKNKNETNNGGGLSIAELLVMKNQFKYSWEELAKRAGIPTTTLRRHCEKYIETLKVEQNV